MLFKNLQRPRERLSLSSAQRSIFRRQTLLIVLGAVFIIFIVPAFFFSHVSSAVLVRATCTSSTNTVSRSASRRRQSRTDQAIRRPRSRIRCRRTASMSNR